MIEPCRYLAGLCWIFNKCWFAAGNVWVFGSWSGYNSDADPNDDSYCNPTTYMFSFVMLIMAWVTIPILCILVFVGGLACVHMTSTQEGEEGSQIQTNVREDA